MFSLLVRIHHSGLDVLFLGLQDTTPYGCGYCLLHEVSDSSPTLRGALLRSLELGLLACLSPSYRLVPLPTLPVRVRQLSRRCFQTHLLSWALGTTPGATWSCPTPTPSLLMSC